MSPVLKDNVGSSNLKPHSTSVLIVSVSFFICLIDTNFPKKINVNVISFLFQDFPFLIQEFLPAKRTSCSRINRYIAFFLRLPLMHRQPATFTFFFLSVISNSCNTFASPVRKSMVKINMITTVTHALSYLLFLRRQPMEVSYLSPF